MKAQSIFPSFNVLKNDYMTRVGQTRIELQVGGAERSGTALYPFANEPMMHKRGKPMQEIFAATSTPPRVHGNETNAASQKLARQLSNGAS